MSAMNHPTAIIAEDEAVLRDELKSCLGQLWPQLRIEASVSNGLEALLAIDRRVPDVAFLDIEMPGLNGLAVAQQIQRRSHVVFVTAYDAYAVAAFDHGAIDYVLKPYDMTRLAQTVARVRERLDSAPPSLEHLLRELAGARPAREYLRWINASQGQEVQIITVEEICYFKAESKYTLVITADGESLIRRPLKELVEQLDPTQFWQVHRSVIVNANAIAGVTRDFRGHFHLKLKQRQEKLPVSESHEHLFRSM